jgi:hypothetical protein
MILVQEMKDSVGEGLSQSNLLIGNAKGQDALSLL